VIAIVGGENEAVPQLQGGTEAIEYEREPLAA